MEIRKPPGGSNLDPITARAVICQIQSDTSNLSGPKLQSPQAVRSIGWLRPLEKPALDEKTTKGQRTIFGSGPGLEELTNSTQAPTVTRISS
ncbi:hypothetical protein KIN20_003025 [Parelaphostrongylus tenuis]|uniref:Uncharacterized protein n=1 Tax=Parelaphostrongylus tenuis TaxID=148309 RepID=A0AAD5QDZ1_PARTN|nr:hypothetical protein KIN20_003025 [Parelaphostrongylus tenuis]